MSRIYQTPLLGEADIRVALVNRGEADLWVYRVDNWGMAQGDKYWYITRDRHSATCLICITSQGLAQVKVCFVNSRGEAGWQRAHPYKGRFR